MRSWGEAFFIVSISFFLIVWAPVAVADSAKRQIANTSITLREFAQHRPLFHNSLANFYQFNSSLYIAGIFLLGAIIASLLILRARKNY